MDLAVKMYSRKSKDIIWNYERDKFNFWTLLDKYSSYHVSSMLKFFRYSRATQRTQNLLQQPAPYRLLTVHDLPTRLTSNISVYYYDPCHDKVDYIWNCSIQFMTLHRSTLTLSAHLTPLLTFRECVIFPICGPAGYPWCRSIMDTNVLPFHSVFLCLVNLQWAALPTSKTQISRPVI